MGLTQVPFVGAHIAWLFSFSFSHKLRFWELWRAVTLLFSPALFLIKVWTFGYCVCYDNICRSTLSRRIKMGFNQGNASVAIETYWALRRKGQCHDVIEGDLEGNDGSECTESQPAARAWTTCLCRSSCGRSCLSPSSSQQVIVCLLWQSVVLACQFLASVHAWRLETYLRDFSF